MKHVCNIYCIGRNYRAHAVELGNAVPDKPMVFMKPTHALVPMNGRSIALPNQGEIHYEAELVVHIGEAYKPGCHPDDIIDLMALGIDFTLRDVQSTLKEKGHPWLPAKGFLNSAPLTDPRPFPGMQALEERNFALFKNGQQVQQGNVSQMIFDLPNLIDYIALHYGLGPGDLIFTGTPEGVGAIADGDQLQLYWGESCWGECTVQLGHTILK